MSGQHLGKRVSRHRIALTLVIATNAIQCEGEWVTLGQIRAHAGGGGFTSIEAKDSGGSTMTLAGGTRAATTGIGGSLAASAGGNTDSWPVSGVAGQPTLTAPEFTNVVRVASLASEYEDDNPTLTSDLLRLYFSSKNRPQGKGNVDVWVAERDTATGEFREPVLVSEVSTAGIESSPAISGDGLTLWIGFEPELGGLGGYDIMQAMRTSLDDAFGPPTIVAELSSEKDDIPRPPGYQGRIMPLASRRDSDIYWTYLATRASVGEPFGNPELLENLLIEGANLADAFLSEDGLTLYFARSVDSISDLFVAFRPGIDAQFGAAIPLSTINTPHDDRDPWLSPDGKVLFFASDRDNPGTLNIYQATRE